jgi:uroporphyrinogen decarboxylase
MCERLVEECGWAAVPARNAYSPEAVASLKRSIGERALVPGFEGGGVFWMPSGSDMLEFAVRLHEQMEDLLAEARAKCEAAKEALRRLVDAGADFLVLTYDFGFNDQPFISPRHFGVLVAPFLAEIVQAAHDLKRPAILHSDGCLKQILDQIHATGIDGYQSVDPQGGMDIRAVREAYPDWLLMGNVPCSLLQDTDEASIGEAVRYCVTHGGIGRRYIFSTSNCIFAGMPADSYRLMLREFRQIVGGGS